LTILKAAIDNFSRARCGRGFTDAIRADLWPWVAPVDGEPMGSHL